MLSYAGVPLLYELDDDLAVFLERFLSLEGGRIFSDMIPAQRELRHGTQGHASHLMGLPTFNWPPEPPPRLNTLRWPSGATRWATCFAVCSDVELELIRQKVCPDGESKTKPAQLIAADAAFGMDPTGTTSIGGDALIQDDAYTLDGTETGRVALSTEMWLLTPKRVTGTEYRADATDRLWILPLVDVRYYWQFIATDSAFYSDVKVIKVSDTKWTIEFIGYWAGQSVTPFSYSIGQITPPTAALTVGITQSGGSGVNTIQEIELLGATCGTFTLTFQEDAAATPETTEPIPFDATAEELTDLISALPSFQVDWESLAENAEAAINVLAGTADTDIKHGGFESADWFPDRTEFRRRHENVAIVLDAIAASTGRRVVRDVLGLVYLMAAGGDSTTDNSKDNLEANLSLTVQEQWNLIAGGWHRATTGNAGNLLTNGLGPDVPESIDVVFRDLAREGRKGTLPSGVTWESQAGLLVVTVPMSEAVKETRGSQLQPFFPHVVEGVKHTIHTPSLNNTGVIDPDPDGDGTDNPEGDEYSKLAIRIAAKYYDWLWAVFDLRFEGVKQWQPTGFDDAWEIEFGRWRLLLGMEAGNQRSWGTRVVSLPRNAMPGQQLVQCGTQCPWTEDLVFGELRETLDAATHPRLGASKTRAWIFLPPMDLQDETEGLLTTHKRAATVTSRDIDAAASPGVFFEAHSWFCENELIWLGCNPFCTVAVDEVPSVPGATCADATCEAYLIDDEYWCLDNGGMTPPSED